MVALKTLIFSIMVPGTVAGVIPWLLLQGSGGAVLLLPSIWMVGFLPLLLGVGLYLWCAAAFTFIGKGTPAPIDHRKCWSSRDPIIILQHPKFSRTCHGLCSVRHR
jgi:hypothetical protein